MPLYSLEGVAPRLPSAGRYFVAPGAHLIGRVELLEDANVWFNCTLRGDNEWISIGARTNIQDNSVLHTDMGFPLIIGADCTIGVGDRGKRISRQFFDSRRACKNHSHAWRRRASKTPRIC